MIIKNYILLKTILIFLLFLFARNAVFAEGIPITLEYAKTDEERTFGLMQRASLPKDHGMLFIYPEKRNIQIWMLNCLIDLSVAFLDKQGTILEIRDLKAYPNKIGYPLKTYEEVMSYDDQKVIDFFTERIVTSLNSSNYALEMNKDWFREHHIKPGDRLKTDFIDPHSFILH